MRKIILLGLIIAAIVFGCTESKISNNEQSIRCNLSDLNIFPHPNDAGVTLAILAMNENTKKARIIRIGDEVCNGYKLYRIIQEGVELKNNDEQTKEIT